MKILRTQYLNLHSYADDRQQRKDGSNKNGVKKMVQSPGKKQTKGKQGVDWTEATNQLQAKKAPVPLKSNFIKISVDNVDESVNEIKVILEYVDMSSLWLTNLYKTYENDLWRKKPYTNIKGKKWLFYCGLCSNEYKLFCSLKNHLNQHLKVYPYVCKICLQKYTNRKTVTNHLKKVHQLPKEQWNDFLIS